MDPRSDGQPNDGRQIGYRNSGTNRQTDGTHEITHRSTRCAAGSVRHQRSGKPGDASDIRRGRQDRGASGGSALPAVPDAESAGGRTNPSRNAGRGDSGRATNGGDSEAVGRLIRKRAENVRLFFRACLTHSKGELAGKAFELSSWQYKDIILPLYGTIRADGLRQYRTAYIEIPRKNGKSTLCAGLALYSLFADHEPGAEVISAAADREQASIVFDIAASMVRSSPLLQTRCTVLKKEIVTKAGGRYRAISADAYTKHGMSCSAIIVDELHAQRNRELWDTLVTSTGARRQPVTLAITTAGYDRESLCYELHAYARAVMAGTVTDPAFLAVIYGAEESEDWTSETVWKRANPGYGVSVRADYFAQAVLEAKASPGREQSFRRLHLNQWTLSSTRWIGLDRWDQCGGTPPDLEGRQCWAGLDLSSTQDISALVLAFPVDDKVWLRSYCWAPAAIIKIRERKNKTRYDTWGTSGHLTILDGEVIDYGKIKAQIMAIAQQFKLKEICIDRWNAAQLAQELQAEGINVVAFGQGYASMSPAAKDFETLVLSQRIQHDAHPVLRWCVGNAVIEQDAAGNIKPSKSKSTEKIDLCVAAIMAVARARMGEVKGVSVYEGRGISTL